MDLDLVVGLVALVAATAALIRQRRDSQRQVARDKVFEQRELSRCHGEAGLLQEQLLLRIEFLIHGYLRLQARIAAVLPRCSDPADHALLSQYRSRIESRLQDLQLNRTGGQASLIRLRNKNFAIDKDLSYFDELAATLRATLSAVDDGGVKSLIVDLENEVAGIEQRSL